MKKTCPRCKKRVSVRARRCRRCGFPFPEDSGPRAAGLGMGVGFPLFLMGSLILFAGVSTVLQVISAAMVVVGIALFFDPR